MLGKAANDLSAE